ncbi:MAG: ClC family H(+)/Cl(-) exchange transporter [Treponema sp.]
MGIHDQMSFMVKQQQGNKAVLLLESMLVGVLTGFAIAGFRLSIEYVSKIRFAAFRFIHANGLLFALLPLGVLALAGLFIGFLIKRYPMIKGSGVAQLEGVFMQKLRLSPWPELPLKFLGGILGIGLGISVGREGPSVQIGAYIGDAAERFGKRSLLERIYLITAGAAAGLAATFNAPFAGIVFALEDLHQYFSPLLLVCIMTASFAADFIVSALFGAGPIFHFSQLPLYPLRYFIFLVGLGIFVALIGHCFKKSIYLFQSLYVKLGIPAAFRPLLPFLLVVPAGLWCAAICSGGDELIESLINAGSSFSVRLLMLLLLLKIIFTGISAGSGAIGGIFVPLLSCGALAGALYTQVLIAYNMIEPQFIPHMLLFGMAACFTTVIKAPLTACVIVLETSGSLTHLGGLVLTCLSAYMTATIIGSQAHDHVLLDQILAEEGSCKLYTGSHDKQVVELPVQPNAPAALKKISATHWPKQCLIIGVIRGEHELIPDGETEVYPGDKLILLVENAKNQALMEALRVLTS